MKHKVTLLMDSSLLTTVGRAAKANGHSIAAEVRASLNSHYNGRCELCGHPARNGRYCHGCSWMAEQADSEWRVA